jgi:hypothetical protein
MLHVMFSESAAATFRQMLDDRGISEQVAAISAGLDFGPISHGGLADRETWLNEHMPSDLAPHDWLAEYESSFFRRVASDEERLIWIAPGSAAEQAGLYWYLSHFGGAQTSFAVADFAFARNWNGAPPLCLSELGVEHMAQLFDQCSRVAWDDALFPSQRWRELVADNSLLRVVQDGQLTSVPEYYFDQSLLSQCPTEWTRAVRVVGNAMADFSDGGHIVGDDVLTWRLRELIFTGLIECDDLAILPAPNFLRNGMVRRMDLSLV